MEGAKPNYADDIAKVYCRNAVALSGCVCLILYNTPNNICNNSSLQDGGSIGRMFAHIF